MKTDKQLVNEAFKILRKEYKFFAKQNYQCCGSCASAASEMEIEERGGDPETTDVAYYHRQNYDQAFAGDRYERKRFGLEEGQINDALMIHWSGNAEAIVEAMNRVGLKATWDGSSSRCVEVRSAKE